MNAPWHTELADISGEAPAILRGIARGIEKESLRVTGDGMLALTPHPAELGSALTHGSITTDYSESLLEFITPVSKSVEGSLDTLGRIHDFVYRRIGGEYLWCASMPCIVAGDAGIPVARYGTSNVGRMKTVYRLGLGHRYGRMMQAIAGIHYNFSLPQEYWALAQERDGNRDSLQDYITRRYLGLIRNFHRWSWLLIYLFGASPAVCASFLGGRSDHPLQPLHADGSTLHLPYATALRMGDLGYNSSAQQSLRVCYNSLDNYLRTLTDAILEPHPPYAAFRGKRDGEYMQLNDSLLQIENEFYSSIRPKRPSTADETALTALHERGIEYVEIRCVDVNPFIPLGIDAPTIRFLDSFLLHCLTAGSPECDEAEQAMHTANRAEVVNRGREPGLELRAPDGARPLADWANELLDAMLAAAELLDDAHGGSGYTEAVALQRAKVRGDEELPSARLLRELREGGIPYARLALKYSRRWAEEARQRAIDEAFEAELARESANSRARQDEIDAAPKPSFEEHLAAYYDQYRKIRRGL